MYAAVDVGGTKTLIAIISPSGKIIERIKFPTPQQYSNFLEELEKNVAIISTHDFKALTVAIPGKVDRKHGIGIAFGSLSWEKVPIQQDLEKITECPVLIENDANLAGLSEALRVRENYERVLYVTISTGIGGGFITNGMIDPSFSDAEVGHILLEHNGKLQRWEEFASGSAIARQFGKEAREIKDDRAWYVIARNIAIGLIDLIATLTPEVIIIGGGVGSHLSKFKERLDEQLKIYDNPLVSIPPIIAAKYPEEAVIYGCYELARMKYGKNSQ
jgi:predicted NBD/HSP70 family sugar kinase